MDVRDVLPRDAIPSVDDPEFGPGHVGADDDEVVVVDGDPPRAYPLRILGHHEVVNDVVPGAPAPVGGDDTGRDGEADVGGRPVAVTWCPICWSAVAYDRRVDGRTLTFGVSGKLADDSLVLYDRETETEWQQTSGRAIAGEFEGRRLAALPAGVTTYGEFRDAHPDGVVLQPPTAGDGTDTAGAYDVAPYEAYRERDAFGLHGMRGEGPPREWDRTDLDPKTVVLGVEADGDAVGYPAPAVAAAGGVLTDRVGGTDAVVVGDGDRLHAYADPGHDWALVDGALRGDGAVWTPATGESDDGRSLDPLAARRLFAFAWQDLHGPDAFYGLD
jgi:hypothetical protein